MSSFIFSRRHAKHSHVSSSNVEHTYFNSFTFNFCTFIKILFKQVLHSSIVQDYPFFSPFTISGRHYCQITFIGLKLDLGLIVMSSGKRWYMDMGPQSPPPLPLSQKETD